jgi:hypothetical protein
MLFIKTTFRVAGPCRHDVQAAELLDAMVRPMSFALGAHHVRTCTSAPYRPAHALLFPLFLSWGASSAQAPQAVGSSLFMNFVKACGIAGLMAIIERVSTTLRSIGRDSVCSLSTGMIVSSQILITSILTMAR